MGEGGVDGLPSWNINFLSLQDTESVIIPAHVSQGEIKVALALTSNSLGSLGY